MWLAGPRRLKLRAESRHKQNRKALDLSNSKVKQFS